MANNIMNQICMKGITELPYFTEEKNQYTGEMEKGFDFNKIIPMPEELMLTQGGYEEECIRAALSEINTVIQNEGGLFNVKYTINIKKDWVKSMCENCGLKYEEATQEGLKYLENAVKYGFLTWYEWRRKFWGTKSNSYDLVIIDEDTIKFETAWCAAEPIVQKLAELYPDRSIEHKWASEDKGNYTGCREYCEGEAFGGLDETQQDAFERYIELWGESECLYQDEGGMWHQYDCDDCPHHC